VAEFAILRGMDPEYARKKALMDWIVDGMAGRHYQKPVESDAGKAETYPKVKLEPCRNYNLAKVAMEVSNFVPNKVWDKIPIIGKGVVERKKLPLDEQKYYWATDIYHGYEDNFLDYAERNKLPKDEDYYKAWEKAKQMDKLRSFGGFPITFPASKILDTKVLDIKK